MRQLQPNDIIATPFVQDESDYFDCIAIGALETGTSACIRLKFYCWISRQEQDQSIFICIAFFEKKFNFCQNKLIYELFLPVSFPGKYGADCKEQCSVNCAGQNNLCSREDGTCNEGCDADYRNPKCDDVKKSLILEIMIYIFLCELNALKMRSTDRNINIQINAL
ncbi:hypothetical protein PoB_006666900 [Plakobranchus ocellatus]|uniref:LNR domain-containing protein n=1 Tax=Plakobranchus ocellatus TaxID=259542 RepID=A0AAV4D7I1_9GAST|nr:hypothetical protein PoB_006666900 [Plakobranchus ocellatus]